MDLEIKNRILQLAKEQFLSFGFSKVSMNDLSSNLGMSKKTLYNYFSSKEEILYGAFKSFKVEMSSKIDNIINSGEITFTGKIKLIFTEVGSHLSTITPYFLNDIKKNAPKVWNSVQEYKQEAAYKRFSKLLDDGIKHGSIRKDINKTLVIMLYLSAIETMLNSDFVKQIPSEFKNELPYSSFDVFKGIVSILFDGILIK